MKTCGSCGEEKSLEEFHRRTQAKDGRQSVCKECNKEQRKEYYRTANGRAKNITTGRRRQKAHRKRIYDYLCKHPCVDCGESDPIVLQFDHQHDKLYGVSDMARAGMAWTKIAAEIEKCLIRCANCHAKKTARDFGWYEWLTKPD